MHASRLTLLLTLLLSGAGVSGADLGNVDRTIDAEPTYESKPKYCLLVFGPEAVDRVWMVVDGDYLYVDRNGNGNLTEQEECVSFPPFEPSSHPADAQDRLVRVGDVHVGGLTHTGLSVRQTEYRKKVGEAVEHREDWQRYLDAVHRQVPDGIGYMVWVELDPKCYGLFTELRRPPVSHVCWMDESGLLAFANRPEKAPVLHFGGPLTIRVPCVSHVAGMSGWTDQLYRGSSRGKITLTLGTRGLGPGTFVTLTHELVPPGVHPVADVEFPSASSTERSLRRRYVLDQRCCGDQFSGAVRVPKEADLGMASVLLSFDDWKEGRVTPARVQLTVAEGSNNTMLVVSAVAAVCIFLALWRAFHRRRLQRKGARDELVG